ncbi:TonB-dependent receptor [Albimonas sp. CAU 1670]|uniref:TonB-dependent receptor domain-containing protein n=1 Tax=Albimonas sp. CAU 1670 TaxID=3032599 RepID=UPI0023DC7FE6|nr:TonB-dependent receptor [Albimonas sp. CAU 1670]MDF2235325.1 TonB-dependent receptor [Albimonas sp. CAU 1670]
MTRAGTGAVARLLLALAAATTSLGEVRGAEAPIPRPGVASGSVVARQSGETIRFVEAQAFDALLLGQDLLAGDVLRTGPAGLVSILFADRTVMRLHRDSELVVNAVSADGATLTLRRGTIWARSRRGQGGTELRTPTAAAAVRGTDWSVEVTGDGTTRLAVYDGSVALSNALGSVTAGAGEQALAAPGRAPVKLLVAPRREQAQMIYTLSPDHAVEPLLDAAAALAGPGAAPLSEARFAEAAQALRAGRPAEAARGFEAAAPGLDPERRAAAGWLAAFARASAGEGFAPPPEAGARIDGTGRGVAQALAGDLDAAQATLAQGATPADLAAALQLAVLRDDAEGAQALAARLRADAPRSLPALEAEAMRLADMEGDHRAAEALLMEALAQDPERESLWNALGLARDALDDRVGAEAAFRQAIALAPGRVEARANLAILLMDAERSEEARDLADSLLRDDPGGYLGLRALGRIQIQEDDPGARDTLLRALAAQPAAGETSLMLAVAAWQAGDLRRAEQELDAARRLDPNDPLTPEIRTAIALDRGEADAAIVQAREALRLQRSQGGQAWRLAADRRAGSRLAEAFSFIGLDDWARDVGDAAYDPLAADSLFAESVARRISVGRGALDASGGDAGAVQGLQIEPLAASARLRTTDLLRRPFVDVQAEAVAGFDDVDARGGRMQLEAFDRRWTPLALSAELGGLQAEGPGRTSASPRDANLLIGAAPSPRLGLFGLLSWAEDGPRDDDPIDGLPASDAARSRETSVGLGGSVRLAGRAYLTGFATYARQESDDAALRVVPRPSPSLLEAQASQRAESWFAGLGWRAADAGGEWAAGIEAQGARSRTTGAFGLLDLGTGVLVVTPQRSAESSTLGQVFLDRRQRLTPELEAEAGIGLGARDDGGGEPWIAPRAGLAWRPPVGGRFRAAILREAAPASVSLSPATVLGLAPLRPGFDADGELWGGILRWDADLGARLHLAVEHQSLRLEGLRWDTGDMLVDFGAPRATLHATEATANLWLGGGFGLSAGLVHADGRIDDGPATGRRLPATPDWTGRAGLAWANPAQLRASLEAVWTSDAWAGPGAGRLGPVWTVDAALSWEPLDKRLALGAELRNLLDAELERPFGQRPLGRSIWLTAAVRF